MVIGHNVDIQISYCLYTYIRQNGVHRILPAGVKSVRVGTPNLDFKGAVDNLPPTKLLKMFNWTKHSGLSGKNRNYNNLAKTYYREVSNHYLQKQNFSTF